MEATSETLTRLVQTTEGERIIKPKLFKNDQEEEYLPLSACLRVATKALSDFEKVESDITAQLQAQAAQSDKRAAAVANGEDLVRLSDFMAAILMLKVKFHIRFLAPVREKFRLFETLTSGFLDFENLDPFLRSLDEGLVGNERHLFAGMLGSGWRYLSFSQVVETLSQSLVQEKLTYQTVLEKIYKKYGNAN